MSMMEMMELLANVFPFMVMISLIVIFLLTFYFVVLILLHSIKKVKDTSKDALEDED